MSPPYATFSRCLLHTVSATMSRGLLARLLLPRQVLLFHRESVEALGDMASEVAEYCHRKLVMLHDIDTTDPNENKTTDDIIHTRYFHPHPCFTYSSIPHALQCDVCVCMFHSEAESMSEQQRELDFGICISALTILRYLMEHITVAPVLPHIRTS